MASRAVRTEAARMVRSTELRLVLGVSWQQAQVVLAVSKLTLLSVLAVTILEEGTTQLCLVTRDAAIFTIVQRLCLAVNPAVDKATGCRGAARMPAGAERRAAGRV